MTSMPESADERLLSAHDLARAALQEVTPAATIGDPAGYTLEEGGVVSLRFYNRLAGYPNWFWTVSVAVVEGAEPTVLEVELLPGEGALVAPEWVPWAERLAEYQAAQAALAAADEDPDEAEADDEDEFDEDDADEDELDDEELDVSDFSEDGSSILHAGDLDGVDIDELDDSADDDADEDDSDDADDEDDEDDADNSDEDADDSDDDDSDDDADDSDEDDSDEDDSDDEDEDEG
jgi:hypothetical protein